jgi:hypothetical protein
VLYFLLSCYYKKNYQVLLGVNSSLTISALAFKIAENIAGSTNLPVEPVPISGGKIIYFSK